MEFFAGGAEGGFLAEKRALRKLSERNRSVLLAIALSAEPRLGKEILMLEDLSLQFETLEEARTSLTDTLRELSEEQLQWNPGPDRWSILMVLQHIVTADKGMRETYEELANHPLRNQLETGKMADVVLDILNRDVPVEVPDPGLEPDGNADFEELLQLWSEERRVMAQLLETVTEETRERVMFSHPAAGPMDAAKTLEVAIAHLSNHKRQVGGILNEFSQNCI